MDFYRRKVSRGSVPILWIVSWLIFWAWTCVECTDQVASSWSKLPVVYICTYSTKQDSLRLSSSIKRNHIVLNSSTSLVKGYPGKKKYRCWFYVATDNDASTPPKQDKEVRNLISDTLPWNLHSKCWTLHSLTAPLLNGQPPPLSNLGAEDISCAEYVSSNARSRITRSTKTLSAIVGKAITIHCGIAGYLAEDVMWEKDSLRLPVNHRQRIAQDGSLVLEDIGEEDEGAYKCTAKDSTKRDRTQITVLRVIAAPTISLSPFEPDIRVGMRMKALCSVLEGDPPFRFKWFKDGIPVPKSLGLNLQYYRDWSMLSTDKVQLNHAGNYTCIVTNEADTTAQSSVLRVNESPKWVIEPQDTGVVRGKSVKVDCIAKGSPLPSITWKRAIGPESRDFTPVYNSHKYTLYANGSLIIQNVDKSEEGYYLCQANNGFGSGLSKLLYLTIHEPPKFEIKFKAHAVKKGDSANLFCQAVGDHPIKIGWWKGTEQIQPDNRTKVEIAPDESKKTISTTLTISQTKSDDSDVYICRASNAYGEDETRVQLLVQEPPGSPPNLEAVNITGRSITLVWKEPHRGNSAITRYLVQYGEADGLGDRQNHTVPSSQMQAIILNLKPSTPYTLRVLAENSVGWGEPTRWINETTDEEAPGGPAENVSVRATGPNSIKVSWMPPKKDTWHGRITGYYVGYKPVDSSEVFLFKTLKANGDNHLREVHLTNLKRSTRYVVTVQAFNDKGTGPATDEVSVKTLDDVPPSAPILKLLSTSHSSITIGWSKKQAFGNSVRDYLLYHRKEGGDWKQTSIKTETPVYVLNDLTCGTEYRFYITAHNSVGKSEPSQELTARTDGAAPQSPAREDFITPSMNEATLNLLSWKGGGCDITHFTIKVRQKFRRHWRNVANELSANQSQFVMNNLSPSTVYELHVTAHSPAGDTESHYEFKTSNASEQLSVRATPELPRPKYSPLVTDLEILIPIVVSSLVVFVVVIVGCILCSKETNCNNRHNAPMKHSSSKYSREAVAMKEISYPPGDCMSSDDGTQRSSSQSTSHYPSGHPLYCQRPEEKDTQPYATPYDTLPMDMLTELPPHSESVHSLSRVYRTDNIYTSRQ